MSAESSRGFLLDYFALIFLHGRLRSARLCTRYMHSKPAVRGRFLYMYLAYLINLRGEKKREKERKREKTRKKEKKEKKKKKRRKREREERG